MPDDGEPLTRGAHFASYVDKLRAWGELEQVAAHLPDDTRSLVAEAPSPEQWIPLRHNIDLFAAVEAALGGDPVRALAYEAARDSLSRYLRPIIELALHAFGASPGLILSNADAFLRHRLRGQTLAFAARDATSGDLEIVVHGAHPPRSFFEAWAGVVTFVLDLCGTRGTVTVTSIGALGPDDVAVLRVTWA